MGHDDFRKGYDFSGRTIVMTGGTGVLGSEMAVALARAGANVVILARDPSRAGELKGRLAEGPGSGTLVHADFLRIADPFIDRRSGDDRREAYELDCFAQGGIERRSGVESRQNEKHAEQP